MPVVRIGVAALAGGERPAGVLDAPVRDLNGCAGFVMSKSRKSPSPFSSRYPLAVFESG
ncbi:MAG: hypothetical protein M3321_13125 [Actinomycetota bacterium]|nr:hypothetical protein [Actinomycetota bacterium]